jgi:hypothetical protein
MSWAFHLVFLELPTQFGQMRVAVPVLWLATDGVVCSDIIESQLMMVEQLQVLTSVVQNDDVHDGRQ